MLESLAAGQHDAGWMADYARGTLRRKSKQQELRRALDGTFTEHQRWMLREHLKHLESLEAEVSVLEADIAQRVMQYDRQMQQLVTIPGVQWIVAWTVLAELGPDMTVFDDDRHAASWACLCPGNRESGGKRLSGRTRKGNRYLRRALCQAAWAAAHTKATYLAAMYRRLRGSRGHNKAILALAHQLLIIAYHILRTGESYKELGENYYDHAKPHSQRQPTIRGRKPLTGILQPPFWCNSHLPPRRTQRRTQPPFGVAAVGVPASVSLVACLVHIKIPR